MHDDLRGQRRHEVGTGKIWVGIVHKQLLPLFRIVLGIEKERHFFIGTDPIGVHQAGPHEEISMFSDLIVYGIGHDEGLCIRVRGEFAD